MTTDIQHCCDELQHAIQDDFVPIIFVPRFREYGISILDGGTSFLELHYCPWCGQKLPTSLRDEWFDYLWSLGLDPESEQIPLEYQTEQWWLKKVK